MFLLDGHLYKSPFDRWCLTALLCLGLTEAVWLSVRCTRTSQSKKPTSKQLKRQEARQALVAYGALMIVVASGVYVSLFDQVEVDQLLLFGWEVVAPKATAAVAFAVACMLRVGQRHGAGNDDKLHTQFKCMLSEHLDLILTPEEEQQRAPTSSADKNNMDATQLRGNYQYNAEWYAAEKAMTKKFEQDCIIGHPEALRSEQLPVGLRGPYLIVWSTCQGMLLGAVVILGAACSALGGFMGFFFQIPQLLQGVN